MTCAHCEELQERIAYLEGELGLQREATDRFRVSEHIYRTVGRHRPQVADFILVLYRARGRVVTASQAMLAIPPRAGREDDRESQMVTIWAHAARAALGRDAVATVHGRGYQLTEVGVERVGEILAGTAGQMVKEVLTPRSPAHRSVGVST